MQITENVLTFFAARWLRPEGVICPKNRANVPLVLPGLDTVSWIKSIWVRERSPAYHAMSSSKWG